VMREVKSFFIEDNSLNKGYTHNSRLQEVQSSAYYQKLQQNLPPVDVVAAYEELYPGTLEKLLVAVEKEQKHTHARDLIHNKFNIKAAFMGRMFGFFSILTISYVTLSLARSDMLMGGLIFAAVAFAGIFGVSLISARANKPKPSFKRHNNAEEMRSDNDKKPFGHRRYPRRNNNRRPR
jgi:uncharacterized membrane protein